MIRIEQLTKMFGSRKAVDEVSFEVAKGEIVGFLGPNGAGKSTTMRMLAGSLAATSGHAYVGGLDVFSNPQQVKRRIGYLPERPPLYADMTVHAYLCYAARLKGLDDPVTAARRVVGQVGLEEVAGRLIGHLSKGYRQRVGLAQALVHDPEVLILDEPASGLDPAQRVEIRELVKRLAEGDVTVVLSTHVLQEVEAICHRAVIIHKGRVIAQDRVESLGGSSGIVTVEVARPDETLLQALRRLDGVHDVTQQVGRYDVRADRDVREDVAHLAVSHGLLSMRRSRGLEEVFLQLTAENS